MPLYAYRCNDCGHEFEVRQKMSDDPLTECPTCAGEIRRVINQVGIVFKGSGFYVTDNKSKNPAAPSSANGTSDTPTPADSNNGAADKSESSSLNADSSPGTKTPAETKASKVTEPASA